MDLPPAVEMTRVMTVVLDGKAAAANPCFFYFEGRDLRVVVLEVTCREKGVDRRVGFEVEVASEHKRVAVGEGVRALRGKRRVRDHDL